MVRHLGHLAAMAQLHRHAPAHQRGLLVCFVAASTVRQVLVVVSRVRRIFLILALHESRLSLFHLPDVHRVAFEAAGSLRVRICVRSLPLSVSGGRILIFDKRAG